MCYFFANDSLKRNCFYDIFASVRKERNGIRKMQTAAYYFPNYHCDRRNEEFHGTGWSEWELVKCARPRFEGHRQPRIPLWGYLDEADPSVMAKKIDAAADHGIDAFVFDWYWYDGPYLQRALDEGFLRAPNRDRLKFALMWANHDWHARHPVSFADSKKAETQFCWSTSRETIGFVWDYLLEHYLTRPEYWRVDGKPYFSIYSVTRFIDRMGGPEQTAEVLELFRRKARAAGLPGIHINAIWFDNLDNQPFCPNVTQTWHREIGFDSYTSYNSNGTTPVWEKTFPTVDFGIAAQEYVELAARTLKKLPAPYYPVVTAGWDTSPRTVQSDMYCKGAYPFLAVMDTDPALFRKLFLDLKELLKDLPESRQIIFFNAWNEWTEGCYLEPDTVVGYKLLEIIREVKGI